LPAIRGEGENAMSEVKKIFDERQIARRVEALAADIAKSLPREVMLVPILKGSFVFAADLMRALDRAGLTLRVGFLRLSSYGRAKKSSRLVRPVGEIVDDVAGRDVLIVDDIVDTGRSLVTARSLLLEGGAATTCVLLDKPSRREVQATPDFVGFTIDDVFVVGYGIDFAEQYRHLSYIGTID
jgi:hypoxanthine phosphoribosyltransferase